MRITHFIWPLFNNQKDLGGDLVYINSTSCINWMRGNGEIRNFDSYMNFMGFKGFEISDSQYSLLDLYEIFKEEHITGTHFFRISEKIKDFIRDYKERI